MVTEYWLNILNEAKAKKEKRRLAYAKKLKKKRYKKQKQKKPKDDYTSARKSKWYRAWRRLVIKEQGYVCNRCGTTKGKLHVHHKKYYKQSPKDRLVLKNGEVLCFDCHDIEHDGYLSRCKQKKSV